MPKRYAAISVLLVVLALVTGCGGSGVPPTVTPALRAQQPPPDVPGENVSPAAFEPADCQFDVPAGHQVDCGYLVVPQDHSRPEGPTLRLHVAIFRSTSPHPEPDAVIHLVGGPGGSLLDAAGFYLRAGGTEILKKRDYILFNQRGTRYATPSLECPGKTQFNWELAGQGLSREERDAREASFLLGCHNNLLEQGVDLSAYNSAQNAADVTPCVSP